MAEITRPTIDDDTGTFTDGTVLNEAFFDLIFDEIDGQTHSATNPTQTPAETTDEVIAARGNLASLDARISGVVDDDGNPVAAAGQATETQLARAEGNFNLVSNSDLEDWTAGDTSAPDNYALSGSGAAIVKTGAGESDTTDLGTGTFAAKITSGGGEAAKLTQEIIDAADYSKYRSVDGRKVGFTIRAKVANSNVLRVAVDDGTTVTTSAYATGSGDEQDISVVHTISASATKLDVYAEVALGAGVAYVGGFTAVFSDLAPAAWTPLWAKFRADILNDAESETVRIGGTEKSVPAGGVLLSSIAQATQSANGAVFYTIPVPAGFLANDGDRLRLTLWGDSANVAQSIYVGVAFGATGLTFVQSGSGTDIKLRVDVEIQRITATTQRMWGSHFTTLGSGAGAVHNDDAAPGETLSGAVDITVTLSATGTRSTTLDGYVLEFLPAVA